jgi:hypothetical protein
VLDLNAMSGPKHPPDKDSKAGRRLLYVCDWLPPDFGAVGQYAVIAARGLAADGLDVTLAGLSTHGDSDTTVEIGQGRLREIKLATRAYDKAAIRRRAAWTVGVNTRLIVRLWGLMRSADTILFTGSPPLFLHWIAPANLILRKELVYRITDFHPECAIAQRGGGGLLLGALYRLTLFWRRRVDRFEALGEDQIERLVEIGIARDRISLKRDSSPVKILRDTQPLERPGDHRGKLLLLYSGNWGVAHDVATFVEGYRRHHAEGSGRFVLWLNAVGANAARVADALVEAGLPLIRSAPAPLDRLASLLVTPDAHLITLSDPFVGFVLPSKVYGCLASQRPILFVGSRRSDVDLLCRQRGTDGYRRVDVGDADGCCAALEQLADVASEATKRAEVEAESGLPASTNSGEDLA